MILHKRGKEALTLYQVKEQFKHAALLEVEIKTGRTHQIRLHMASISHPLLVDSVYGNQSEFLFSSIKRNYKASGELERPTISRLTLHSWRLGLKHPTNGKQMQFECELPKDMQTLLKLLRKYDK
jgi:23S rRNA pseudouridine1911/1915/1917 synthase